MILDRAASVAGLPPTWLCIKTTGWSWLTPASAREAILATQLGSDDPCAFQSSVSTDQFQTDMPPAAAAVVVAVSNDPYGGLNRHGRPPTIDACRSLSRRISSA